MKKISKILLSVLALTLALSLASCKKGEFDPPSGMITASDEEADFYLYVPDNWTVDITTAMASAYYSSSDPSSVSVMGWSLEHTDDTVDTWWEVNKEDLASVFSNFTLESEENTTVDGVYGKKFVYTASLGEYSYKFMQVAFIKNTTVYLFTYTATADRYDSHLDDVAEMLEYLTLK